MQATHQVLLAVGLCCLGCTTKTMVPVDVDIFPQWLVGQSLNLNVCGTEDNGSYVVVNFPFSSLNDTK